MHLHFTSLPEKPDAELLRAREEDSIVAEPTALGQPPPDTSLYVRVDAFSPTTEGACRAADNESTRLDGQPISCPHHPAAQDALDERVRAAARLDTSGVILDRPDAWYAVGDRQAGFCDACNERLNAHLQKIYEDQYVPYAVVSKLAEASEASQVPFWREHSQLRLESGLEAGARLSRRVRDEARLARKVETWVGARLTGMNAASVQLARKLDFVVLPVTCNDTGQVDPAPYEVFAAAVNKRAVVGLADSLTASQPARALQASRYASALGASLSLPEGASAETIDAVAEHRRFTREFQTRYRPVDRYAEVLLVYSPECDHWTNGRHGRGVRAAAEALSRVCAQYRVVLGVPRMGSEPLVLADAGALPHDEARHLQARVRDGATAIVVGQVGGADELGRLFEPPLGDLSEGLEKVGNGSVFGIDPRGTPDDRPYQPLVVPMDRALESLLGRGRRVASTNRPSLLVKLFLDPDRKLDVHLVGRAWNPTGGHAQAVQGAVMRLSGAAVGGARTAWLFSPGAPERKVTLTAYDMGVQARLPDFIGSAVLTVSR